MAIGHKSIILCDVKISASVQFSHYSAYSVLESDVGLDDAVEAIFFE